MQRPDFERLTVDKILIEACIIYTLFTYLCAGNQYRVNAYRAYENSANYRNAGRRAQYQRAQPATDHRGRFRRIGEIAAIAAERLVLSPRRRGRPEYRPCREYAPAGAEIHSRTRIRRPRGHPAGVVSVPAFRRGETIRATELLARMADAPDCADALRLGTRRRRATAVYHQRQPIVRHVRY